MTTPIADYLAFSRRRFLTRSGLGLAALASMLEADLFAEPATPQPADGLPELGSFSLSPHPTIATLPHK